MKKKSKERGDGRRKKQQRQQSSLWPLYFLKLLGGPKGPPLLGIPETLPHTSRFDNLLTISVILTRSLSMDGLHFNKAFPLSDLAFYSRFAVMLLFSKFWDVLQQNRAVLWYIASVHVFIFYCRCVFTSECLGVLFFYLTNSELLLFTYKGAFWLRRIWSMWALLFLLLTKLEWP